MRQISSVRMGFVANGGELPLGDDKLLSKKRVLGDQFDATANEIRG